METKEYLIKQLEVLKSERNKKDLEILNLETKIKNIKVSKYSRFRNLFENHKIVSDKTWKIYYKGLYNHGSDILIDREIIKHHLLTDIWRISDFVVDIFKQEYKLNNDEICDFIQKFLQNVCFFKATKVITNKVTITDKDFEYTEINRYKEFNLDEILNNNNIEENKVYQHLVPYRNKDEEQQIDLKFIKQNDIELYTEIINQKEEQI